MDTKRGLEPTHNLPHSPDQTVRLHKSRTEFLRTKKALHVWRGEVEKYMQTLRPDLMTGNNHMRESLKVSHSAINTMDNHCHPALPFPHISQAMPPQLRSFLPPTTTKRATSPHPFNTRPSCSNNHILTPHDQESLVQKLAIELAGVELEIELLRLRAMLRDRWHGHKLCEECASRSVIGKHWRAMLGMDDAAYKRQSTYLTVDEQFQRGRPRRRLPPVSHVDTPYQEEQAEEEGAGQTVLHRGSQSTRAVPRKDISIYSPPLR
ncbi:hypothetical protein MMC19_004354 [Ptychographa xylographoides]|nr:hypothetical protein [Ptychographa xylographoides]